MKWFICFRFNMEKSAFFCVNTLRFIETFTFFELIACKHTKTLSGASQIGGIFGISFKLMKILFQNWKMCFGKKLINFNENTFFRC